MQSWRAFLDGLPVVSNSMMKLGDVGFGKIQSIYGAARLWGASFAVANVLQAVVALLAAALVVWIWIKPIRLPVKAAALVTGTLLATPYLLDYDLVLLALAIAWLFSDALGSAFLPWEKSILLFVWLFPLFARPLSLLASLPLTPLLLGLLMLDIFRRSLVRMPAPSTVST
jgi:alpha-1,2-mannosyltransferase